MSVAWEGPDDVCPRCQSADMNPANEGSWASCNDCGFVQYDLYVWNLLGEITRGKREITK
jgi:hypothetical protein